MHECIFDLGFHNGDDTDYYLKKGYNVVAIEGNPELVNLGNERFKTEISNKNLILINRVLSDKIGEIPFYLHPTKHDWSSCKKQKLTWDGTVVKEITIKTISLNELYRYYVPYYIKTDIEGNDTILVKQLYENINYIKPKFVSFELSRMDYYEIFSYLHVAGYNSFQLVNQANNKGKIDEEINYIFTEYSSGLFGEWLPKSKWLTIDETLTNYMKYKELKIIDNQELALGWVDLHATVS